LLTKDNPIGALRPTASCKVALSLFAVFMAALFAVMTSAPAHAESRTCKRLESQLASLGSGGGRPSRRVSRAINNQQKQIGIAKRRLRQLNCSKRRLFFFRDAHPSCKGLRGALQRMRNNIAALKARGGGNGGARSTKRQRKKIRRALRRHECGVTRSARRNQQESIADQVLGNKSKERKRKKSRRNDDAKKLAKLPVSRKTSRMLCVRTCDGYFFPVSLSTKRNIANGDAKACETLCPGTEMKLYFRKSPGDDPKKLVSVASGKPYTALPTAFAYQKSFNPNCSCNYRQAVDRNTTIAGEEKKKKVAARTAKRAVQKTAMPIWRPDSAADPETTANRRGKLDLAALGAPNEKRPFDQISQRNVRVIGETFLPSQ